MRELKRLLVTVAAVLAALSGCNRSETVRIGVIPKALAHEFWGAVHAGADEAAREAGVTIEWQGPATETAFSPARSKSSRP